MENTLVPTSELPVSKYASQDVFDDMSSGSFLPRVQLFGSNSNAVKEGKMPMAHYGLVNQKDSIFDLGEKFDFLVIHWRPKAMKVGVEGETPLSYFNPKSPDFQRVQAESEVPNSGAMFGPEFLIYIPSVKKFALFFMSSKTARRAAKDVMVLMGKAGTLSAKLIKTPQYTWHGPVCVACSTPFDLPDMEEIKKQAELFGNPADSQIEPVSNNVAADERPR